MTISELLEVQQLEQKIWNISPLPIHQTLTAVQNGGLVIGAFIGNQMLGFSYGFAGFADGKSYLCSHMLGIDPDYRGGGIGGIIKQKQREYAIELGYDKIVWTYDPLETRNGYLNLSKLGAACSLYIEDCYGSMEDNFNSGIPSDRFKVEWILDNDREKRQAIQLEQVKKPFSYEIGAGQLPKLNAIDEQLQTLGNSKQPIAVPVPAHFQELKAKNHELALEWRLKTREIIQTLFSNGYAAAALVKTENELVYHYVCVQKNALN